MNKITFVSTLGIGLMLLAAPALAQRKHFSFDLVPASDSVTGCLANASAKITVWEARGRQGVETLLLRARGLPANATFVVFLTEQPVPPFGAAQYIADFTTNPAGNGHVRANAIISDAFSTTLVDDDCDAETAPVRVRTELNHVVFWFADPAVDDVCLGAGAGSVTPFDGDGEAGTAAMSSRNFLPEAPLP
jgi:hypothetical protein